MVAPDEPQRQDAPAPTLRQTIASVAASFFGVQSSRNRTRDFSRGKPLHFIVIGLLMTVAFVAVIVVAVKLALRGAGLQ